MPKYIDYNYVCFSIYIDLTIICTQVEQAALAEDLASAQVQKQANKQKKTDIAEITAEAKEGKCVAQFVF